MHECENYLDRARNTAILGNSIEEHSPVGQFETLSALYFPELAVPADRYLAAFRTLYFRTMQLALDNINAKSNNDHPRHLKNIERYNEDVKPSWGDSRVAQMELVAAARRLLEKILPVMGSSGDLSLNSAL